MDFDEFLYRLGESVESLFFRITSVVRSFVLPERSQEPPRFKFLSKAVKRDFSVHEKISMFLQLVFLCYLTVGVAVAYLGQFLALIILSAVYFLVLRFILVRYSDFILEFEAYRVFYLVVSVIAFVSYAGYMLLKKLSLRPYWYYAYLVLIGLGVLLFRRYFKSRYGRDYTYGVVEEVKNDLVRVFVHDDIAANVKPGYYWVPAVQDVEPGAVVKLLVEDRVLRSARPVRILEVYLNAQSSQMDTEPKDETE